ncbi:C4-dicarboxylate ABC transporter [Rhodococcus fascians]|nr:C4-dicarboxylate ABC transporter [Rhodococcus fascians]MBY3998476.1 C4-dicarboxylate ABC transporter [Rhodococcus fascians]MBY4004529.1 C4-dicarboxylate ABC transporter [Rhodococcus fascians]MBY4009289.1 C4-dicarboxylate ABC transporter [Rhodococcus fascians]MBY4019736.1 C4-dicarboxylate ABC transporter [Rhodococcus fascians]
MTEQVVALAVCVALMAVGIGRGINIGVLMFAGASAVGVLVADIPLTDIYAEFPVNIFVLLVGITFFFGIAQANGTVNRIVDAALRRVGDRTALIPAAFFAVTAGVAALGNPFGAVVMFPIAMTTAHRRGIDPMLMGLALGTGVSAGGFAPTSLFGIVSAGTAESADIDLSPALLFLVVLLVNAILLTAAYGLFGHGVVSARQSKVGAETRDTQFASATDSSRDAPAIVADGLGPVTRMQILTMLGIVVLGVTVIVGAIMDTTIDIGILSFALGGILCVIQPDLSAKGLAKIDWQTVVLVTGIITYVGVLQAVGALNMLGEGAADLDVPILAALLVCFVAALVSAFASTTAMLALLVPLAIPLINAGGIPGWAMICAIGVCASIVDVSPFSSVGATIVATTVDPTARPRMARLLTRWGLSLVLVGPAVMIGLLVLPAMLAT